MNAQKVDLLNGWHHPKNEDRVRVVVLYEDVAMGRQAKELLDRVENEFEEALGFEFDLWRVDALRKLDSFMTTISEAANADMVVVAVHVPALAEQVWKWFETWAGEAREDTALVVLFDRRYGRQHARAVQRQLEELIVSRRVTVFVESVEVEELSQPAADSKEAGTMESIIPIVPAFTGSTPHYPETFETSSWARGGINE